MIDEKRIQELKSASTYAELERFPWFTLGEMVSTLETLWKVARAAKAMRYIEMNDVPIEPLKSIMDDLDKALKSLEVK